MRYFINTETIKMAYKQLTSIKVANESILHIFFILKGAGYNRISFEPVENISKLGYEKAKRISFLFSPEEQEPEKYDFINPFDMSEWHMQSPSEPLKKWVSSRVKNNVLGGATTWRSFIIDDAQQGQFKFTYNYVEEISKLTIGNQKINLIAFSIWANRFTVFEKQVSVGDLIRETIVSYNLEEEEINQLFTTNSANIKLEFNDKIHNAEDIRRLIGNPSSEPTWVEASLKTHQGDDYSYNLDIFKMSNDQQTSITLELVMEGLTDYGQVILSGPPGTSKSFLADLVSKKFDEVKRIQFHPQYSYQEFVGGYIVNKTEVEYRKGVLLEVLEFLKENPDKTYLLIIDEINRANISQVFGETIQCLDRNFSTEVRIDGQQISITLPKNLYILGTMNSSDRTLGSIDHAVRRRFLNIYVPPNPQLLIDLVATEEDISLYDFLRKVNENLVTVLKNRELVLGHSVFLNENIKKDGKYYWPLEKLETLMNYKILPTIEEYCYGDEAKIKDILGESLPKRLHGEDFKAALVEFCSI